MAGIDLVSASWPASKLARHQRRGECGMRQSDPWERVDRVDGLGQDTLWVVSLLLLLVAAHVFWTVIHRLCLQHQN